MSTYSGSFSAPPPFPAPSYSAMDAISPAIQRTRDYLFRPFRLSRFVLLALVAAVTEGGGTGGGGGGSFRSPFPGTSSGKVPLQPIPHPHLPPASVWVPIAVAVALILLVLSAILGYLAIRLRFSFFDCVLDRHDQIAAGWRKYKSQAWRYFIASFCVGLGFLAVFAAIGLALFLHFRPLLAQIFAGNADSGQRADFGEILAAFALVALAIFVLAITGVVVQTTMSQFILPRLALENASFRDACVEVWDDMHAEPGQFALFMLMRLLVPMAAGIAFVLVLMIPIVIVTVIGVVIALTIHASPQAMFYLAPLAWPAMHFAGASLFMLSISFSGTLGTWLRNYGILFYASRYPALGKRLWPSAGGAAPPEISASVSS